MTKACAITACATVTANVATVIEEEMTKDGGTFGKVIVNTAIGIVVTEIVVTEIVGVGIAVNAFGTVTAITAGVAPVYVSKTKMATYTADITENKPRFPPGGRLRFVAACAVAATGVNALPLHALQQNRGWLARKPAGRRPGGLTKLRSNLFGFERLWHQPGKFPANLRLGPPSSMRETPMPRRVYFSLEQPEAVPDRFARASSWTLFINVWSGLQQISQRSRLSSGMICLPSLAPLMLTRAHPRF
jgi:hypothetical protein